MEKKNSDITIWLMRIKIDCGAWNWTALFRIDGDKVWAMVKNVISPDSR